MERKIIKYNSIAIAEFLNKNGTWSNLNKCKYVKVPRILIQNCICVGLLT